MNKIVLTALLAVAAMSSWAETAVLRKSGDCKIQVAKAFDDSKAFITGLTNADVSVTCKFTADDDFFGSFVVMANPTISNKSGKAINVSYHVVFLDKAGELVGGATQDGDLKPGAEAEQFGSCIMRIPPEQSAKIASYKIVIYVSDAKKKE